MLGNYLILVLLEMTTAYFSSSQREIDIDSQKH